MDARNVTPEDLIGTMFRAINFIEQEIAREPYHPMNLFLIRDAECFRIMIRHLEK